jgi:hypothetical protein
MEVADEQGNEYWVLVREVSLGSRVNSVSIPGAPEPPTEWDWPGRLAGRQRRAAPSMSPRHCSNQLKGLADTAAAVRILPNL